MRRALIPLLLLSSVGADGQERCVYRDDRGRDIIVESASEIPVKFRAQSRCVSGALKKPDDVRLDGNERRDTVSTSLGPVDVRWPRSAETIFGQPPHRAIVEGASAIRRFLLAYDLGVTTTRMNRDWKVVIFDSTPTSGDVPSYLMDACHPGWMTPPGNIYLVAQRAVAGCRGERPSGSRDNDIALLRVIVHEMGHAIEAELAGAAFSRDRARAEGFASWVEALAMNGVAGVPRGSEEEKMKAEGCSSLKSRDLISRFSGSGEAYAQASLVFGTIFSRRGASGIRTFFETYRASNDSWLIAASEAIGEKPENLPRALQRYCER